MMSTLFRIGFLASLCLAFMAAITFPAGKATLLETAPGVSVEQVLAATEAKLLVPDNVPSMRI